VSSDAPAAERARELPQTHDPDRCRSLARHHSGSMCWLCDLAA
jgi:hypothetical protein